MSPNDSYTRLRKYVIAVTFKCALGGGVYIGQSLAHFLCPIGKHYCLSYHFSASELISLPFHIGLIRRGPNHACYDNYILRES